MSKTKKLIGSCRAVDLNVRGEEYSATKYERKFVKGGMRKISRNASKKEMREQFAEWEEEINEQMELIMLEAAYYREQEEVSPDLLEAQDRSFKEYTEELCALGQLSSMSPFELVCSEGLHPDDTDYDW